jgi:hypothetical protein
MRTGLESLTVSLCWLVDFTRNRPRGHVTGKVVQMFDSGPGGQTRSGCTKDAPKYEYQCLKKPRFNLRFNPWDFSHW